MKKKDFALCSFDDFESDYETLVNKSCKCTMEVRMPKSIALDKQLESVLKMKMIFRYQHGIQLTLEITT